MFSGFSGFGGGKSPEETSNSIAAAAKEEPPAQKSAPSGGGVKSIHGFDPNALERAAKAAKELDTSKNAREAIKLITSQETTKQKEHEMERAKFQAKQQELAIMRVREEEDASARTLEKQSQHEKQRSDYKDQLDRKRMADNINAQRHLQEDERKKSEDSLRRQEEIRRKTLEYEAELRQQTEMARVRAETDGRILQERQNHDLVLDNKRVEAKEYRETVLEGIKLAGSTLGKGFVEFVSDKEKLANVAGTLTVVAFGVYTARISTGVIGRHIEARLGKPSLVRETTKKNIFQTIRSPIASIRSAFKEVKGKCIALSLSSNLHHVIAMIT